LQTTVASGGLFPQTCYRGFAIRPRWGTADEHPFQNPESVHDVGPCATLSHH